MRTSMSRIAVIYSLVTLLWGESGILAPQNRVTFSQKEIGIIVKSNDADVSPSSQVISKDDMDGLIHFKFLLNEGMNFIEVKYLVDSNTVVTETLQVVYHPSRNNVWRYPYSSFHSDKNKQKLCSECHTFDTDDQESCFDCHTNPTDKKDVTIHPPMEDGCSDCHEDFVVSTEVCSDCHDFEDIPRQHAPFAIGDCVVCHNPHASTDTLLLRKKTVVEQCGFCHDLSKYSEGKHPVSRHPLESKNLTCVSCHNPHGSEFKRFLIADPKTFCTVCHESK